MPGLWSEQEIVSSSGRARVGGRKWGIIQMNAKWKKVHLYQCPCGYSYEPEKGDPAGNWKPGTPFDALPDQLTCPRCQRAKIHFREKKFSVPRR